MESRSIAVPILFYGAVEALQNFVGSLERHLPQGRETAIPDSARPADGFATAADVRARLPLLRYFRGAEHLGFVKTCNAGMRCMAAPESDVFLLNSDTEGFQEEIRAVLDLGFKNAFVCPRGKDATGFSAPPGMRPSQALWIHIRACLRSCAVMPAAVGCYMLIGWQIWDEAGLFDEIFGLEYEQE